MSYSTHHRDALNSELPLRYRVSHVRSLAMLMGEKYRVHRDVILDSVLRNAGVDLNGEVTEAMLLESINVLDRIKQDGIF